jgi:hypothetical protein
MRKRERSVYPRALLRALLLKYLKLDLKHVRSAPRRAKDLDTHFLILILAIFNETLFFIVSGAMFQSLALSLMKVEVIILLLPGPISDTLPLELVLESS